MSNHKDRPDPAFRMGRRGFLARAGALSGVLGAMTAFPAFAGSPDRPRSLRFVHTHTGESLTAPYFDGAYYSESSLRDVNALLRDFRTGESHRIDPPLLDIL